ncbi:MAG: methyltransferase domain-containing protein [Sedimenticola sp.]
MREFNYCRLCELGKLNPFLNMERIPKNVSVLLNSEMILSDESTVLDVYKCDNCNFVQLNRTLDDKYYDDYLMTTSHTDMIIDYLNKQSEDLIDNFKLLGKKIIDVGCGDGQYVSLLQNKGLEAYGIEPSKRFSKKGRELGLKIYNGYVSESNIIPGGKYDAFVTRQVLEHVPDPINFLKGIKMSLNDQAVGVVEVPCLEKALENHRFYDFFPDHLNYYSISSLSFALEQSGFSIVEIKRTFNDEYLQATVKFDSSATSSDLQQSVLKIKNDIKGIINKASKDNKRVAVWGSGAKGLVSLAVSGIENGIEYIVDSDENKQNLYSPVTHIPVYCVEQLIDDPVDIILITALAFEKEILKQLEKKVGFTGDVYVLGKTIRMMRI